MKRLLIAAGILLSTTAAASAQSLEDLNIQIHGYATQGGLFSNHNSWDTTDSASGSAAWTDVVVNLSAQPESRLHIGVQTRFFLLGDFGKTISLDWAQADFKLNEAFGIRVGKVKTPIGLLNESQDIDPSQLWILLPQAVYPIASRNTILTHYGGVIYGSLRLGEKFGKLQYRGFGGERVLAADDGYFQSLRDQGIALPNGISGHTGGGSLKWQPPIHGLLIGATESSGVPSGEITLGPYTGTIQVKQFRQLFFFSKYERNKLTVATECSRFLALTDVQFNGLPDMIYHTDERSWYAMASYKLTSKLSGGLYFSSLNDHKAPLSNSRFQKDWALTARYDFTAFLYAKIEQHWMDGTAIGYSLADNPNLQATMRMSLAKMGVTF